MKSQDIFLLFKLVAVAQYQQAGELHLEKSSWQDWVIDELLSQGESKPLELTESRAYSMRSLAHETGISKTQVSLSMQRCYESGLLKEDRKTALPKVNTAALLDFIVYGLRYVFPVKPGEVTRGIATGLAAPVLQGQLMSAGDLPPVWSDALGKTKGVAIEPLFKSVPQAIRSDPRLYAYLALSDAIRVGLPRERALAEKQLRQLFKGEE